MNVIRKLLQKLNYLISKIHIQTNKHDDKSIKLELESSFLKAISNSFCAYKRFGARSNKKLLPIHLWFAQVIESRLDKRYSVKSLGKGGESTLDGKYYTKTLDISILKENSIITTVSFKFVISNYKQNSNNYFKNLLGEAVNIRRINVGFAHFLVLRKHTPYYDEYGKEKKLEIINENDLLKYVKLFEDLDFSHKPEVLGIAIVDFDDNNVAHFVKLNSCESEYRISDILENKMSISVFIDKVIALCKLKS